MPLEKSVQILCYWIKERELIRRAKERGEPKPWTADPILRKYRFCNVHREDDTVTKWIRLEWGKYALHENYTTAMAMARFINWPDTLEYLGYPVEWDAQALLERLKELEKSASKVWTSAYIVSTNGNKMLKADYVILNVLDPIQKANLKPAEGETLEHFYHRLHSFIGVGSFYAGQIIADLKNTAGNELALASDYHTWCISGPGSRRGYNRILNRNFRDAVREKDFLETVWGLRQIVHDEIGMDMDAQDMQNCLCEYDKYMRVKLGEGKPRQQYPGV